MFSNVLIIFVIFVLPSGHISNIVREQSTLNTMYISFTIGISLRILKFNTPNVIGFGFGFGPKSWSWSCV